MGICPHRSTRQWKQDVHGGVTVTTGAGFVPLVFMTTPSHNRHPNVLFSSGATAQVVI